MPEKITLSGVPETMLQTLYARARESQGRGVIQDKKAEELIARLDYDFTLAEKDTAMRSGVMLGSACMVDGMIDRIDAELGGGATVVATGGIARFVLPMCRHAIEYDRDLLLKGLALLYENNRREK